MLLHTQASVSVKKLEQVPISKNAVSRTASKHHSKNIGQSIPNTFNSLPYMQPSDVTPDLNLESDSCWHLPQKSPSSVLPAAWQQRLNLASSCDCRLGLNRVSQQLSKVDLGST